MNTRALMMMMMMMIRPGVSFPVHPKAWSWMRFVSELLFQRSFSFFNSISFNFILFTEHQIIACHLRALYMLMSSPYSVTEKKRKHSLWPPWGEKEGGWLSAATVWGRGEQREKKILPSRRHLQEGRGRERGQRRNSTNNRRDKSQGS